MEEATVQAIRQTQEGLGRFPASLSEEFERAYKTISESLSEAQTVFWASAGLEIAQLSGRSWEAASSYYSVTPSVLACLPFNNFIKWTECGSLLCKDSPKIAAAFFMASPDVLSRLRSGQIETWANLGRGLHKGTWKSSTLACNFFTSSPELLNSLRFSEFEQFVTFLESVSHRSYDLAGECLTLSLRLFPALGPDKGEFISLASALMETGWREVKGFFEASVTALTKIQVSEGMRFLKISERLLNAGGGNTPALMHEMALALSKIEEENHGRILALSDSLTDVSPQAVPEFIKGACHALERITIDQLDSWFNEGMRVLSQNKDGGLAFFRIESAYSEEVLETLSSGVEFVRVRNIIEMYCRALAGADVKVATADELVTRHIGWISNEAPSTEGSTVFVPSLVDRYPVKTDNFAWFKVIATHQVAHIEFDSFLFEFDKPSGLFKDMRHGLWEKGLNKPTKKERISEADGDTMAQGWVNDMQRLFDLFEDRKLALDIFTVVEDGRLDSRVKSEYPGIRNAYTRIQTDSLENRPDIQSLPMREAVVEFLVRVSLQQTGGLPVPRNYVEEAQRIASIVKQVFLPHATVEDVAEATIRIYAIVANIPNEELTPDDWENVETDGAGYDQEEDMDQLLQEIGQSLELGGRSENEGDYEPSRQVDYRGDFKPELVQLLARLRMQQEQEGQSGGDPITRDMLEELLKNSAELDLQSVQSELQNSSGVFANNILKEMGLSLPQNSQFGQGPFVHVEEEGGSLESDTPQTFVYDEWDFRADDYKPRWCIVRQKTIAEGTPTYYASTLHNYGSLVTKIRRQFELMVPEMLRKVSKLEDGEDIDIDDVIEAFVDIRTGSSPGDKFYWKRNKVQRDVAVAFLLDTSASTAEAIDETKKKLGDLSVPDDPVEYMEWVRNRRGEATKRTYKRIIDVEKEAIILLVNALETTGDLYGIYGFSGYGRENVEFYTIKDLDENFSERVKKRIDRIAPLHATRMGPAIRHATYKLKKQDARTKLLFLISDGRPQDRGYSREGVEKEYAVHDTKMALNEARRNDINAFCLTVDKNGHDYLKTMCQDIGYEVLDDIYALPERLPYLYKRLTM